MLARMNARFEGLDKQFDTPLDEIRDLWRAELRRVKDARLKRLRKRP